MNFHLKGLNTNEFDLLIIEMPILKKISQESKRYRVNT